MRALYAIPYPVALMKRASTEEKEVLGGLVLLKKAVLWWLLRRVRQFHEVWSETRKSTCGTKGYLG
jgi:hypothetical protein